MKGLVVLKQRDRKAEQGLADLINKEATERLPPRARYWGKPDLKGEEMEEYQRRLEVEDKYLPKTIVLSEAPDVNGGEDSDDETAEQNYQQQSKAVQKKPKRNQQHCCQEKRFQDL